MGLDFDAIDYCRTLIRTPPPYKCPVEKCGKSYKSIYGLQYHLVNFDHDNPQQSIVLPASHKKKGRGSRVIKDALKSPTDAAPKDALTYLEAQKMVQFDIDGKSVKVSIDDVIPIVTSETYIKMVSDSECTPFVELKPEPHIKLPMASVKLRTDYNICDAAPRPNAYIRFIEKSAEEMDCEVEYDVDEEDTIWLDIINKRRANQNLGSVGIDSLEILMDRLEKESYFQAIANGQSGVPVDDDAVCCICLDGECQNTNVILFCDMCNLAVHQDCYGVPYIPEGQWLCRRCLQSPSRPVECVLCPNTGGAFKQTDRGQWAHVVCALWIPEVRFANTVFLEPIDSIETIPAARWRLTCYICKQKGKGACIQCQKNSCYAGFHVTCAQQAGLHMKMDTVKDNNDPAHPIIVQKTVYCDVHNPTSGCADISSLEAEKSKQKFRLKLKEARKMLAKKRTSVPLILVPTIPPDRLHEIASLVNFKKKSQFFQRLIAYWTLKRQYRNGVPLLRRLQSQGQSHHASRGIEGSPNASELYQQLKYWQCLRQDLERARLLCELVRKREKLKAVYIRTKEKRVMMELNPLETTMLKLLEALSNKDVSNIFGEPVDVNEVPDYMDIVTHPMDLSTMRLKLASGLYFTLDDFENDFNLMISNCLAYNDKDTIFYKAGIRMRDQGSVLLNLAKAFLTEKDGNLLNELQQSDEMLAKEIDNEFKELSQSKPSDNLVTKLETLLEKALKLKHGLARAKRNKNIRFEISKIKKTLSKERAAHHTDSSQSDVDIPKIDVNIIPSSPPNALKTCPKNVSPSGVNRRTAVLFTRKAQAALKKPELLIKEETPPESVVDKLKSSKKNARSSKRHANQCADETDTNTEQPISAVKSVAQPIPDSFRIYRGQQNRDLSDSDESQEHFATSSCSSCSGLSRSESGTDFRSSSDDDGDDHMGSDSEILSSEVESPIKRKGALEPLQLVWAKCLGYPWYPALIIDPSIPKGFQYNGVPLPAPPPDVLALRKDKIEPVYLVLFFDAKRTWQWLPPNKLELLGIDKDMDQSKLIESRKPTDRKSVKKAYQDALNYQNQVSDPKKDTTASVVAS